MASQTVTWGDIMMLKRFLGVLAVCLFAMAMAIVGCGGDDEDEKPPPPPVLTPMEKLAGNYSYVEGISIDEDSDLVSGEMHLRPEGRGWIVVYEFKDEDSRRYAGPTWSATDTTITFIDSRDQVSVIENYTLEGKFLTLASFEAGDEFILKWRKD